MNKIIDFNKSLLDLSKEYPEVVEIMKELGFTQIAMPGMLNTVGRFMTIPKGAASKGISIEEVRRALENKGFTVIN
jgi:sugar phosphate isomerase/epimerase